MVKPFGLLLAGLAVLSGAVACATFASPGPDEGAIEPSGPSHLEEMLGMVPERFSNKPVEFADYEASREAAGMDGVRDLEAYVSLDPDERSLLYRGLPRHDMLRDYMDTLNQMVGLDLLGFDQSIWLQQGSIQTNFMVLQGAFDEDEIVEKLLELEYKEAEYKGVSYYWLFEEPRPNLRHPLRDMAPYLNRIALMEDRILVGSTDRIITALINVQLGETSSLLDHQAHQHLAKAVGNGLQGGTFIDPTWLENTWEQFPEKPVASVERYVEGPDEWGELSQYELALLGYKTPDDVDQTVVALYYRRTDLAERNASELEKRWNTFQAYPSWGISVIVDGQRENIEFRPGEHPGWPVTDSCTSFSTSVIEQRGRSEYGESPTAGPIVTDSPEYSALIGTCEIIESDRSDTTTQGARLWQSLYESRQLAFLIWDLDLLREANTSE